MKGYKIFHKFLTMFMAAQIFAVNAHAYIDVSATTYLIQITAGAIIAASTVIGIVITKIKRKAKEKFNIDLEKKEKEEELIVYDSAEENNGVQLKQ